MIDGNILWQRRCTIQSLILPVQSYRAVVLVCKYTFWSICQTFSSWKVKTERILKLRLKSRWDFRLSHVTVMVKKSTQEGITTFVVSYSTDVIGLLDLKIEFKASVIFYLTFLPGSWEFYSNFLENVKFPPYAPPPPCRLDIDRCIMFLSETPSHSVFQKSNFRIFTLH